NHFVAMVDKHLDGVEQSILAAGRGDDFFPAIVGIEVDCMTMHDGIAQLGCAWNRRIFREVAMDSGDGCVFDVLWRGEMWLAGAEVHHVDTLCAEIVGL